MKTIWRIIGGFILGGALLLPAAHAATGYADSNITTVDTRAVGITSQPQSQTINAGANVTFTVAVVGVPPFRYQWLFNGQKLAGWTAASLSLTNVQFANAGGYSVVVTNTYGSVTSAVAQLTVYTNLVFTQTNRAPTTNEIGKPTIPTDPTHFKVYTNGTFKSGIALNPNKMTVVLTHGWNSSPSAWAAYTAQIIQQRIGINAVNIVAWDWTADATSSIPDLGVIAAKTPGEGTALGTNLVAALGANYSKRLHFIGHSLGTLVNAAAANYLQGDAPNNSHQYFNPTNTQMTLCDEAESAWELNSTGWQMATTLPDKIGQLRSSLSTLNGNFSTPQRYWDHPLPQHFAWADNYISACGLLHPDAANAILTYEYPDDSSPNFASWKLQWFNFHNYSHYFYEDTIEPSIYNTGGQINATYMGFISSFEGGGIAGRPATNTVFYQDTIGLELHLVQTNFAFATNFLNGRFDSFFGTAAATGEAIGWNAFGQALGQVNGQIESVENNVKNMFVNLRTSLFGSGSSSSVTQSGSVRPWSGPVPNGGSANNTPAYAWIPLNVPSNVVSMSFDFMLQGNGNNDSFQVALNGTNILSLETILIQTNVTMNSGLINVSQYAGQQVELFLGIVGGTSTNAALTVSDFQFYSVPAPSLQGQLSGTNFILSWPVSASGYTLQTTTDLTQPNSWMAITNPVIVNFQYTITNPVSGNRGFYRLIQSQ
jgi:pimeloyl-ACP methyl ester carboxylesterase